MLYAHSEFIQVEILPSNEVRRMYQAGSKIRPLTTTFKGHPSGWYRRTLFVPEGNNTIHPLPPPPAACRLVVRAPRVTLKLEQNAGMRRPFFR